MSENQIAKKGGKVPHGVLLLFIIIVLVAGLTHLIPAGQFGMIAGTNRIDPDSFAYTTPNPAGFLDIFLSIPLGFQDAAALIAMILTIGGAIGLVERTGAISSAIAASSRVLGPEKKQFILVFMTTFFASLGAFPAMMEAMIPFAPIAIAVALVLGYDILVGMSMPLIGAISGWTSGVTNLWTVGIGHDLAGLPLFSGLLFRLVFFFALLILANGFILHYAAKIDKNPKASLVADLPRDESVGKVDVGSIVFTTRHKFIMLTFAITIIAVVATSIMLQWNMTQLSAIYIMGAIVAGTIAGFGPNKIVETFLAGSNTIFIAAFTVGIARGITIMMQNANIIHTIVYYLSQPLSQVPPVISSVLMIIVQTVINFFIPSSSGQAMAVLPIMLPLGQLIGLSEQVTILAFQIGDGFSNLIFPTVPVLVAYLAYTKVPLGRWLRYIAPFYLSAVAVGILFTIIGVIIGW